MKKYLIVIAALFSTSANAQNPDFEWVKVAGGGESDLGLDITTDGEGNIISTGYINEDVDFELEIEGFEFNAESNNDYYMMKHDNEGKLLWVNVVDTRISYYDVTTDASGNIYVTGVFGGTVDFDPGMGLMARTSNGETDFFVQKIDKDGALLWVRVFGGSDRDVANYIELNDSGDIHLMGRFETTVDFDPGNGIFELNGGSVADIFVLKLNSEGLLIWVHQISGSLSQFDIGLSIGKNQEVFISGVYDGGVDFGQGAENVPTGFDYPFILNLDQNGDYNWVQIWKSGGLYFNSIMSDNNNNLIVIGGFRGTRDFDPSEEEVILTANGVSPDDDVFILSLDSDAKLNWVKSFGNLNDERPRALALDENNSIYITGDYEGIVDFDPGEGIIELNWAGERDVFLQKLDSEGSFVWAKSFNGPGYEVGYGVAISPSADIYITGSYSETVDFDPDAEIMEHTSLDARDIFVLKMSQCIPPVPDLAQLPDLTAECTIDKPTSPTAVSNCGGAVQVSTNQTFPITTSGVTEITWTYEDEKGNQTVQIQKAIINDENAPIPNEVSLADLVNNCEIATLSAPLGTDNCSGSLTGTTDTQLPITESTEITWTFDDGNGNTSTQTQNVIINNNAPVPKLATLEDIISDCALSSLDSPQAEDDCDGTIIGSTEISFPISSSVELIWKYEDNNGNAITQTQNIIINDVTPVPNIASLEDIVSECSIETLDAPTAQDACNGTITGTTEISFPISTSVELSWKYEGSNGNVVIQTQNVVINDVAPVPDVANLVDIVSECILETLDAPTAQDVCDGSINGTSNLTFPITSSINVQWKYEDEMGNISTQNQSITITADISAPVPNEENLETITEECVLESVSTPIATDNCNGTILGTHNLDFPITESGEIEWKYEDESGNVSTQTQNILIEDTTLPDSKNIGDETSECSINSLEIPTTDDNCDGELNGVTDAQFPITESQTIEWKFTDAAGNVTVEYQDIIINPMDNSVSQEGLELKAAEFFRDYQWIDCNNNTPIPDATERRYFATKSGSYAVEVSNGECTVVSECIEVVILGIEDQEIGLSIYPNPTKDQLNIEMVVGKNVEVWLLDNIGQKIYAITLLRGSGTIDMSNFSKGMYFAHFTYGDKEVVKRILRN